MYQELVHCKLAINVMVIWCLTVPMLYNIIRLQNIAYAKFMENVCVCVHASIHTYHCIDVSIENCSHLLFLKMR